MSEKLDIILSRSNNQIRMISLSDKVSPFIVLYDRPNGNKYNVKFNLVSDIKESMFELIPYESHTNSSIDHFTKFYNNENELPEIDEKTIVDLYTKCDFDWSVLFNEIKIVLCDRKLGKLLGK